MSIIKLMKEMVDKQASDLFYRAGGPAHFKIDGKLVNASEGQLQVADIEKAVEVLTTQEQRERFQKEFDIDFAFYIDDLDRRYRVSIFIQRNTPSIVIRNVRKEISTFDQLGLPTDILQKLSLESRGLVLMAGSMGSGKSTTIASMIEYINQNCQKHVLTIEEPIEFTFTDNKSMINQREVGLDVSGYDVALRSFTLQSPDVIFIGNIRDYETMSAAMTAAETGVLVLSTLHSINSSRSVERIINFFPPYQHQQVRKQLADLLKGVISLRLLPQIGKPGRIPAYETMLASPTISRLIREGNDYQIPESIEGGAVFGMQSFNQTLVKLVKEKKISEETAKEFSDSPEEFVLALRGIKKA
ncbi:MAG: PilT/PilU family type 4a pilus ATPase [Candidatus Omnitrophica bacterium]|nr:PilT/PilU family type 4a pilus ATPase [Candidatus Omnitrophota bacterium]